MLDQVFEAALEESGLWERIEESVHASRTAREKEEEDAQTLLEEMLAEPPDRHAELLRSCRRFQTLALCELLLHESNELRFRDVGRTLRLAELATELAGHLDAASYGGDAVEDLKARAWAQLGNALRLNERFRDSDQALNRAEELAGGGSGDPLLRGQLLDLRASLRRDQRHLDSSGELLEQAFDTYTQAGQPHYAGRILVSKAALLEQIGEASKAVPLLHQALDLIDPAIEPRIQALARHTLTTNLCEAGRPAEARAFLAEHRGDYFRHGDTRQLNKLHWVEGKIAAGLGEVENAEVSFQTAAALYLAEGAAVMWAVVSLELAALYLELGQTFKVREIADQVVRTFEAHELHRDAFAAVVLFKKAAETETATVALLADISKTLLQSPRPAQRAPF